MSEFKSAFSSFAKSIKSEKVKKARKSEQPNDFTELIDSLVEAIEKRKLAEKEESEIRIKVFNELNKQKLTEFKIKDYVAVKVIPETSPSTTIDSAKIKELNPDLFDELIEDYGKEVKGRKSYISVKIK